MVVVLGVLVPGVRPRGVGDNPNPETLEGDRLDQDAKLRVTVEFSRNRVGLDDVLDQRLRKALL